MMARKHLGWYIKGLHGSAELRNRVNFMSDPDEVLRTLNSFYAPYADQPADDAGWPVSRAA